MFLQFKKMAKLSEHGIRLSCMSPSYLYSNSTSHTWPFSAIAELIDNACDPGVTAKQIWIDVVEIKGNLCLTFTDNGYGMTPSKLHKMLSFGFTEKGSSRGHQPIGVYGNGFKSGSMRLGKDAMIFTKNGGCLSVGLLSQTYLEHIRAKAVIVPIAPFNPQNNILVVTEDSVASLGAILAHSLFQTQEELLEQLDSIPSKKGTKIIIWNIRRNKDGKPELDFETDAHDIRIPDLRSEQPGSSSKKGCREPERADQTVPEMDYSLREYCSILYLKPRTQIILRQKKVQTKLIAKSLANIEHDVYKPNFINKRVRITFGFNYKNKEHYGIMMYHNNRLIKSYEKVGCQIKSNTRGTGVGVIGVIECNFLKPAHNKQDFEYTKEYRLTLAALGLKLNDYWKVKKANKLQDQVEDNKKTEETQGNPDQHWVQCEECLKWRKLPFTEEPVPEPWYCHLNPDPKCRSCIDPEEPEESEDELTPSYEKTFKKQDLSNDRKRSMSLEGGIVKPELSRGLSGPPNLLTSQEEEQVEGMEKGVAGSSVPSKKQKQGLDSSRQDIRPEAWGGLGDQAHAFVKTGLGSSEEEEGHDVIIVSEKRTPPTLPIIKKEEQMLLWPAGGVAPKGQQNLWNKSKKKASSTAQTVVVPPRTREGWPVKALTHGNVTAQEGRRRKPAAMAADCPESEQQAQIQALEQAARSEKLAELEKEAERLRGNLRVPTLPQDCPTSLQQMRQLYQQACREKEFFSQGLNEAEDKLVVISAERDKYRHKVAELEREKCRLQQECHKSQQEVLLLRAHPTRANEEIFWGKKYTSFQYQELEPLRAELDRIRREKRELENRLSRQGETQEQGTSPQPSATDSSTMERLRMLRQNVANLLTSVLPHLDLKEISFDTGDIDHILEKVIEANKI
ncbi:MORC family CW-type zinc finger protein 4-like isoform X1 [Acipenser ruthenus]|uniref:MORC family CW-type zinc finger protein 4-like isoform X1 n=2 Tax=Acipenser ruthenus TaxID=7906 RepID=UPI0027418C23|nr:MORC family CW-type zinc finger protein 4-like isoform X1 [Acipenser ruthenus]